VSKEQKTGKSTFLHWLCHIYGDNSIVLGNEDFNSNFNASWASKLVIGIDESFIEKKEVKEKIKRLVTDDSILMENKGVDKERRDFFGKFILLSNNEDNFIQMEKEDSRFFVLKIPSVKNEDPFLDEKMLNEIPAFLHFLQNRKLIHEKKSRLWFKPKDYETDALKAIVKSSKTIFEKVVIEHLTDLKDNIEAIEEYANLKAIEITPMRLADQIKGHLKYSNALNLKIGDLFKSWGLMPNPKSARYSYPIFDLEIWGDTEVRTLKFKGETGKYYTITFTKINEFNQL
jgi:hypothetical protein